MLLRALAGLSLFALGPNNPVTGARFAAVKRGVCPRGSSLVSGGLFSWRHCVIVVPELLDIEPRAVGLAPGAYLVSSSTSDSLSCRSD
jgi:hypothetical protein